MLHYYCHTFMKEIVFLVGATDKRYREGFERVTLPRIKPSVASSKSAKQMKHVGAHKCNFWFWFIAPPAIHFKFALLGIIISTYGKYFEFLPCPSWEIRFLCLEL